MTRLFETNRNKIFEYHIVQLCAITKNTKILIILYQPQYVQLSYEFVIFDLFLLFNYITKL